VGQAWGGKLPHAYTVRKQISPDDRPLYALENPTLEVCIFFRLSLSVPTKKSRPKFQIPLNQDRDDYVDKLEKAFEDATMNKSDNYDLTNSLFGALCFGRRSVMMKRLLKSFGRRIFFIFGGRDSVTGIDTLGNLEPHEWGLTKMVLPGINHFLGIDEEWKQWIGLVVNLIKDFDNSAARNIITEKVASEHLKHVNTKSKIKKKELLESQYIVQRSEYLEHDFKHESNKEIERKLFDHIKREKIKKSLRLLSKGDETEKNKEYLDAEEYISESPIGQILYKSEVIKSSDLQKALEVQEEFKKMGETIQIGQILVNNLGIIRNEILKVFLEVIENSKKLRK